MNKLGVVAYIFNPSTRRKRQMELYGVRPNLVSIVVPGYIVRLYLKETLGFTKLDIISWSVVGAFPGEYTLTSLAVGKGMPMLAHTVYGELL